MHAWWENICVGVGWKKGNSELSQKTGQNECFLGTDSILGLVKPKVVAFNTPFRRNKPGTGNRDE